MITFSSLLYQTATIRALEQLAVDAGISISTLMERAGNAAWNVLQNEWPHAKNVAVICGKGNNAGDGYVVARLAHKAGLKVKVWQLFPESHLAGAALAAAKACRRSGVKFLSFAQTSFINESRTADVVVDALLGTGLRGALSDLYQMAIKAVNELHVPILSLDVPSGLFADSGATASGTAVRASATITFIGNKLGLFTCEAKDYYGKLFCDDLDIPAELFSRVNPDAEVMNLADLLQNMPARPRCSHKGNFGHILVVGGDYGMGGAVRMAAEAAARIGAGLVSVATRKEHVSSINAARPEIMCHGINTAKDLNSLLGHATCVLLGPGLGQSDWSKRLFKHIVQTCAQRKMPLILDADALNILAAYFSSSKAKQTKKKDASLNHFKNIINNANWILTPHPGEAARLLNLTTREVQQDRYQAAAALQHKFGGVVVLKGAGTLIQGKNKEEPFKTASALQKSKFMPVTCSICTYGNSGMASGGMGDILGGAIGGLVAQGMSLLFAARLGVCLHSKAADIAAAADGERGLLATDILVPLRRLLNLQS